MLPASVPTWRASALISVSISRFRFITLAPSRESNTPKSFVKLVVALKYL